MNTRSLEEASQLQATADQSPPLSEILLHLEIQIPSSPSCNHSLWETLSSTSPTTCYSPAFKMPSAPPLPQDLSYLEGKRLGCSLSLTVVISFFFI